MKALTLEELKDALRAAAGDAGTLDDGSDAAVLDESFDELGYDSLAIMEATARVERRLGMKLPEEEVADLETPAEYLAFVNARIEETV